MKAAYRETCHRHQRKKKAKQQQQQQQHDGGDDGDADDDRDEESAAARRRAKRATSQKASADFFAVRRDEFRILLRNICFYMKVYIMFDAMDSDVDRCVAHTLFFFFPGAPFSKKCCCLNAALRRSNAYNRRLDISEVHEFLNRLKGDGGMKTTRAESEQAFREMDLNGTGIVGFEEFCSWYAQDSCPMNGDTEHSGRHDSVYDKVVKVYESHPACISCTVVKLPSSSYGGEKGVRIHAILVVTSTVGIGTADELRAFGTASLPEELVPFSFETMDQVAMERESTSPSSRRGTRPGTPQGKQPKSGRRITRQKSVIV